MRRRRSLLLSQFILARSARADCEPYCVEHCATLNGYVHDECNDCVDAAYLCRPGTAGYDNWKVGATLEEEPSSSDDEPPIVTAEVDASGSTSSTEYEPLPCQYLDASELKGKTGAQLASLLGRPTIIRGLIDNWPAHDRYGDGSFDSFASDFGNHSFLARRANFAREQCRRNGEDEWEVKVPLRDVFPYLSNEHFVVYNGDLGMDRLEYVLLSDIRARLGFEVPELLKRAGGTTVFSFGGGTGVRMGNHGMAWVGLIAGRKVWYTAPHHVQRPENPTCMTGDEIEDLPTVSHCLQKPKEVMIVPTAWWHATCNLDPYTLGLGGQDSCDLVVCPGFEKADHMEMQFCPTGRERSSNCWGNRGQFDEMSSGNAQYSIEMEEAAVAG